MKSNNIIYDITPFTLIDFPNITSCVLWFTGCNMRCVYCYNPQIIYGKGKYCFEHAEQFVETRKGLLDGIVLSGGECTMHKNIDKFIEKLKLKGFKIKIDTNGSNPDFIKNVIDNKLIDYISLDFKSPYYSFKKITKSNLFSNFNKTLEFLLNSTCSFEVRTTFHSSLHTYDDLNFMINYLVQKNYKGIYYIQNFKNGVPTLSELEPSAQLNQKELNTHKLRLIIR